MEDEGEELPPSADPSCPLPLVLAVAAAAAVATARPLLPLPLVLVAMVALAEVLAGAWPSSAEPLAAEAWACHHHTSTHTTSSSPPSHHQQQEKRHHHDPTTHSERLTCSSSNMLVSEPSEPSLPLDRWYVMPLASWPSFAPLSLPVGVSCHKAGHSRSHVSLIALSSPLRAP